MEQITIIYSSDNQNISWNNYILVKRTDILIAIIHGLMAISILPLFFFPKAHWCVNCMHVRIMCAYFVLINLHIWTRTSFKFYERYAKYWTGHFYVHYTYCTQQRIAKIYLWIRDFFFPEIQDTISAIKQNIYYFYPKFIDIILSYILLYVILY